MFYWNEFVLNGATFYTNTSTPKKYAHLLNGPVNLNLGLCLTKRRVMQTCGGVEVEAPRIFNSD